MRQGVWMKVDGWSVMDKAVYSGYVHALQHGTEEASEKAKAMLAAMNAQFVAACQMQPSGRCEGCGQ